MTATSPTPLSGIMRCATYPLALGMVGAVLCYLAAGGSLVFFLGTVAVACAIVPPLVAGAGDRLAAVVVAGAVVDAIGIAWLFVVIKSDVTLLQWLACYVVLGAFVFGAAGVTWALRWWLGALASAAIVVVVSIGWLSWPIWTSPWITADVAAWLAPAHPLLAMNRILLDLGIWTQQPWMYRHSTLGQDVAFALPGTIWPCVLLHAVMALGLLVKMPIADASKDAAREGGFAR